MWDAIECPLMHFTHPSSLATNNITGAHMVGRLNISKGPKDSDRGGALRVNKSGKTKFS